MKKLLITLILISPFSLADWGDVYYCDMTSSVGASVEGTVSQYKLEKFRFTLDDDEMGAVRFGKSGYFGGIYLPVERDTWMPHIPSFAASTKNVRATFREGKFKYTDNFVGQAGSLITANCEKF
tara:strand:+ start:91 stop:462 length:372 start_codon:yes stop_codon:yes gene_type:complete